MAAREQVRLRLKNPASERSSMAGYAGRDRIDGYAPGPHAKDRPAARPEPRVSRRGVFVVRARATRVLLRKALTTMAARRL